MPIPRDDVLIIDTNLVHSVGSDIASDATNQLYNDPEGAFYFHDNIDKANLSLPIVVQDAITTFNKNFYEAISKLLLQRVSIGDLLRDTGTTAEKDEFAIQKKFDWTLEPDAHSYTTK